MKPRIATLALITPGTRILLGRKQGSPEIGEGTLNGPGGKMEPIDTTILDCVIRETREELGIELNPKNLEKVAIITFYAGKEPNMEVHIFRTDTFRGEPRETESMIPEWHDIDRIPIKERMLESDLHWLPRILLGEKFNANVYYREKAKGFLPPIDFFPFIDRE